MIRLELLYLLLMDVATRRTQITYRELWEAYQRRTGERYQGQGFWDGPLGRLTSRLDDGGLPPLAAVVVEDSREPAVGFWGSCPSVPVRSARADIRLKAYKDILQQVYAAKWPEKLPDESAE